MSAINVKDQFEALGKGEFVNVMTGEVSTRSQVNYLVKKEKEFDSFKYMTLDKCLTKEELELFVKANELSFTSCLHS